MFKHPRRNLFLIIFLTILAIYLDLPNFSFQGKNFSHPQINTRFIKRDLEPKLGLDLAGGVQLVLSADTESLPEQDRPQALDSAKEIIERRIDSLGVAESVVQIANVTGQDRIIVEIPGISDIDQAIRIVRKTAHLEFRTLKADAPPESTLTASPDFFQSSTLTGRDLARSQAQPSQDPQNPGYVISLEFNEEGAKKFEQITRDNLGKPVAIFLDEGLISAPIVQSIISEGNAQITGNFTAKEARDLAIQLNAGALPIPLKIESETRIGPTLGLASIKKSLFAAAVGSVSVAIFMIAYYRILGIFAVLALFIYALITFSVFKLIPVTLTLAGIAGFILSIGMAVDANILIFERIKEELRWGKPKHDALITGFERAWPSIRDSNISSLITTSILFYFGTGQIRGFALTLALGILVSMFSAITVTRTLIRTFWVRKI